MSLAAMIAAAIVLAFWVGLPVLLVGWLIVDTRRTRRSQRRAEARVWREFDRAREAASLDYLFHLTPARNPRMRP